MLWITGNKGFVGVALCEKLQEPFISTGKEVDIADFDSCIRFLEKHPSITHIINCAAFSHVDLAEINKEEAFRSNVLGAENLGQIAKLMDIKVIHLSTDYVFNRFDEVLLKETDTPNPCNYYGVTKLEGERRLLDLAPSSCVLRTSWIFGKGGKNFFASLAQLFQTKEELKLVVDQKARPTFIDDLVKVILKMKNAQGIFHFANRGVISKYEFGIIARSHYRGPLLCKSILPVLSSEFQSHAQRPFCSALDTSKIENYLNEPIPVWEEGLKEFFC